MPVPPLTLIGAAAQAALLSGSFERLCFAAARRVSWMDAQGWRETAKKIAVLALAALGAASGILCAAVFGVLAAATASMAFRIVSLSMGIGILAFAAKVLDTYSCLGRACSAQSARCSRTAI